MSENEDEAKEAKKADETKASDKSSAADAVENKVDASKPPIPKVHTGLTSQFGLPLADSNENTKRYSDVASEYQKLREKNKNLNQSGITQAFGALLPKKEKKKEEEEGWETYEPDPPSPWDDKDKA